MFRKLIWQKYLSRAIRMKVNFRFLRVIMAREQRERERGHECWSNNIYWNFRE